MLRFDSNNSVRQYFSFSFHVIRYLMFNADSENLKKLYKSCKYFYTKIQINIVDELCMDNEELLTADRPQPYGIYLYQHQLDKLPHNLWLTGHLLLGDNLNIEKFLPKIIRCNLYELNLYVTTKFTMNEFKILTRSGTVQEINMNTVIYSPHDSTDKAPLEDILSCVLSAHSIDFGNGCYVTKNTMKKLMQLNFQRKLKEFRMYGFNQMLDANLMDEFLKKNLDDKAHVGFKFVDEDENQLFNLQILEKINVWTPEEKKPLKFPESFIPQQYFVL